MFQKKQGGQDITLLINTLIAKTAILVDSFYLFFTLILKKII